jgi:hypothetical protein
MIKGSIKEILGDEYTEELGNSSEDENFNGGSKKKSGI